MNLEHILPKRASAADWGGPFNADERRDYVHRLGNMALLQKGPNGRIGNKAFSVKKPILTQSEFALTADVGTQADWTKTTIRYRQATLAQLAVKVWPEIGYCDGQMLLNFNAPDRFTVGRRHGSTF